MNAITRKRLVQRKQRIGRLLRKIQWPDQLRPMLAARAIRYEVAERTRGVACGGIGVMHLVALRTGSSGGSSGDSVCISLLREFRGQCMYLPPACDWHRRNAPFSSAPLRSAAANATPRRFHFLRIRHAHILPGPRRQCKGIFAIRAVGKKWLSN